MGRIVTTILIFFLTATRLIAADIRILPDPIQGYTPIIVSGEFELGDEDRFENIVLNLKQGLVIFDSPGGNMYAGIGIGKTSRLKGFVTAVGSGSQCASACALAWLGGTERIVFLPGRVGFHAAYSSKNGIKLESGSANALVGAYLNQLEMTSIAIQYLTEKPPDEINWLTPELSQLLGIKVEFVPTNQNNQQPLANNNVADGSAQSSQGPAIGDSVVRNFVTMSNRDVYGFDLGPPSKKSNVTACQDACAQNRQCRAYSFNLQHSLCYEKGGGGLVFWNSSASSGYLTEVQSQLQFMRIVIVSSTSLEGATYRELFGSSLEECARECSSIDICTGFEFKKRPNNRCTLKKGTLRKKAKPRQTSGIKTAE